MTIIRVRHPKGIFKLELPSSPIALTTSWIYEKIAEELGPLYENVETFWLSLDPQEPETSRLNPSEKSQISFTHGQLLYLHLKNESIFENFKKIIFSEATLDEKLMKLEGKIIRKLDERLCRHGPIGMCENCQPLEVKYIYSLFLFNFN